MNDAAFNDEPAPEWTHNYFNYFTEIEEHFQRARGTALFLLSPLDWALVETWKNSGVPLEAVLLRKPRDNPPAHGRRATDVRRRLRRSRGREIKRAMCA